MRILVIQHTAADSAGVAGEFVEAAGHALQTVRIDRDDEVPSAVDCEALMTFGGPVSLYDPDLPAWVAQEQALIRRYVTEGRRVLGICLGAQMVAAALGSTVRPNEHAEVGWHTVNKVDAMPLPAIASELPAELTTLQWHQNTFSIPAGAKHLYQSEACRNQAFVIDDRVFGFQFHLEANATTVRNLLLVSQLCKQTGPFIQTHEQIRSGLQMHLEKQSQVLIHFLTGFLTEIVS